MQRAQGFKERVGARILGVYVLGVCALSGWTLSGCGGLSNTEVKAPNPRPPVRVEDRGADGSAREGQQAVVLVERPRHGGSGEVQRFGAGAQGVGAQDVGAQGAMEWGRGGDGDIIQQVMRRQALTQERGAWEGEEVEVYTWPGEVPRLVYLVESGDEGVDVATEDLPLKQTQVEATIVGPVAEVEVSQRYENTLEEEVEAVYVFPLPENSAVHGMRLEVAGRVLEGVAMEREEAREVYEGAKAAGYVAALLEQERPNVFTQSVANIPSGEEVKVALRYVQDLTYDNGNYEFVFPMVVGPRYSPGGVLDGPNLRPSVLGEGERDGHDISLNLKIKSGVPIQEYTSLTHDIDALTGPAGTLHISLKSHDTIPNKDFVFRYRVASDLPQITTLSEWYNDSGYLTLILYPPLPSPTSPILAREVIFLIDVSGSMRGAPLALTQTAMRDALRRLRPIDTFNIITFASGTQQLFTSPQPANLANIDAALSMTSQMTAGGGTELRDALQSALLSPFSSPQRVLILATDGFVGNEEDLLLLIADGIDWALSQHASTRLFTLGVGSSVNRFLTENASRIGLGLPLYALSPQDPPAATQRLFHVIDLPILDLLSLDFGDLPLSDVFPSSPQSLFSSHPLILHARYAHPAQGTLSLSASSPDGSPFLLSLPISLSPPQPSLPDTPHPIALLWARAKLEDLSLSLLFDAPYAPTRAQIISLALRFGLASPFTSLIAVDPSRVIGHGAPLLIEQPVSSPLGVSE